VGAGAAEPERQAGPARPRGRISPWEADGSHPFAEFDLAQGTTVVSIGYRLLDETPWPSPVDDIVQGLDDGVQVAQALTEDRITDITETGLSAGGTGVALINYSPDYPTTTFRPDRLITISAPLMSDAVTPGELSFGYRYTDALHWGNVVPKARIPITLMGTPGDPVALETDGISNIGQFADYLDRYHIHEETYFDPHDPGHHGSITKDLLEYPDVARALSNAQNYNG
jgi:hypothetical protein